MSETTNAECTELMGSVRKTCRSSDEPSRRDVDSVAELEILFSMFSADRTEQMPRIADTACMVELPPPSRYTRQKLRKNVLNGENRISDFLLLPNEAL
jgi:hypothetical protein